MTDVTLTVEQLQTKRGQSYLTFDQAAEYTGISVGELRKARNAETLLPDASLRTGMRGRPALLFKKSTLQTFARRYNAARKAEAAAKVEAPEAPAVEAPATDA